MAELGVRRLKVEQILVAGDQEVRVGRDSQVQIRLGLWVPWIGKNFWNGLN